MADDQPPDDDDDLEDLDSNDPGDGSTGRAPVPSWARWLVFSLGIVGAIAHAILNDTFHLHLDLGVVTIAWLGVSMVGLLLPNLASLELGNVKLKLTQARAAAAAQRGVDKTAGLLLQWSTAAAILADMISSDEDEETADAHVLLYIRDRMNDARPFLSAEPSDNVRIALWMYDSAAENLVYSGVTVGGPKPTKLTYANEEGMIGKTVAENFYEYRFYNEGDCRKSPSYVDTRSGYDPPYRAVMGIPIRIENVPVGMLAIDKVSIGKFTLAAEQVARALGAQSSTALIIADQHRKALATRVESRTARSGAAPSSPG